MYIHIGNNRVVRRRDILGIFDLDTASQGADTRRYLAAADRAGDVEAVREEIPKAFVVTSRGGKRTVYMTPLASQTIAGRTDEK